MMTRSHYLMDFPMNCGFWSRTVVLSLFFMIVSGLQLVSPSQMVLAIITIIMPSIAIGGMLALLSCLIWPPFGDIRNKPRDK